MRVFVYYNLHKKCFSIKALAGENRGRVIAHADAVVLADCLFKVSQAGRARVLKEKRKNVHAGVVGRLISQSVDPVLEDASGTEVVYYPYVHPYFTKCGTGEKIADHKGLVYMRQKKVKIIEN